METKSRSRRVEIRKNRPDTPRLDWDAMRASGVLTSLGIAFAFFVLASGILMMRQEVVRYRPNQWIPHDIVSRVDFTFNDAHLLAQRQHDARERSRGCTWRRATSWEQLRKDLLSLPDRAANAPADALPPDLASVLDAGAVTALRQFSRPTPRPTKRRSTASSTS